MKKPVSMQLLLKGVHIIDPTSPHHHFDRDVRIREGIITAIAESLAPEHGEEVHDLTGQFVSVGWVDLMAASGDPGQEYREDLDSLAKAAMAGGYTGLGYMPATHPAIQCKADVEYVLHKTAAYPIAFYPLGAVTRERQGKELTEIYDMHAAGAVAFTDADHPISDVGIMLRTLQYVKQFKGTIMNVPGDHRIVGNAAVNEGVMSMQLGMYGIPDVLEEIMVIRDIQLAEYSGSKLHLASVSSARSVARIREAKARGVQVTASVTPYHLYFDETAVGAYDTNFKVNPPLRTARDVVALKEGIADGTIDAIISYHMPWDTDSKECEFEYAAFGMATLEQCFGAVCSSLLGYADVDKLISLFTSGPRRILQLPAATIAVGQTAELTIFQPDMEWTAGQYDRKTKAVNHAFVGQLLKGKATATVFHQTYNTL